MHQVAQGLGDGLSTEGSLIATGIIAGIAVLLYSLAVSAGRRYVRNMSDRGPDRGARAETLWNVLRRVIFFLIVITAVLFVFTVWGWSLAPFLGVGAILAAALGFGAQDLVKDVVSGFFILLEDQYHVGDTVTIADATGTVEDIQLRVTILRDSEGNQHFVPNGQIEVTSNFTSRYAQPVVDIGIGYEEDIDRALEVLEDELEKLSQDPEFDHFVTGRPEILGVQELGESAVMIRGRLTTDADERWTIRREALKRVKERFDAEGISMPYPQITVNRKE